ncbi:MAG: trimeric intracellular cation channel family protein [Thermomicrobiales bacterium]
MPSLLTSFDLIGTFVFALSGALLAARRQFDVVGVVMLSLAAGLGGGTIRDVLIDDLPPASIESEKYLLAVLAAAAAGFFLPGQIERVNHSVRLLDALGLGFFAVAGTQKAVDAGLGPISAVLIGVIAAAGGGVIRDLLASTTPLLLHQEIYALAALLGSLTFLMLTEAGLPNAAAAALGVIGTFALRAIAIRYQLHAPRPRGQSSK